MPRRFSCDLTNAHGNIRTSQVVRFRYILHAVGRKIGFTLARREIESEDSKKGARDGGLRIVTDLLTAFPKLDAILAINDPLVSAGALRSSAAP